MLKTNSLCFKYHDTPLIEDLNLSLKKGENLTILGANGAGKSTLARLLCGLIPSHKQVKIKDIFIEDIPSHTRASLVNYMPAKFSLFDPYVKVSQYLALSQYPRIASLKECQKILLDLGLEDYHDTYAKHLSSGEQQLLQLGACLLQNASLTIFDEPTSNLDPQKTKRVFDILKKKDSLQQKILITHDLQLAHKLGFPVLYLQDGDTRYFEKDFFSTENLKTYFDDTIQMVDNHIVTCL